MNAELLDAKGNSAAPVCGPADDSIEECQLCKTGDYKPCCPNCYDIFLDECFPDGR